MHPGVLSHEEDIRARFKRAYGMPDYLWRFARTKVAVGGTWTMPTRRRLRWPYFAWALMHKLTYRGAEAAAVDEAYTVSHAGNQTGELLRALRLAEDASVELVARELGLAPLMVEAFETLFLRVLDRRADRNFLVSLVYPDGAMAVGGKDYLRTAPHHQILRHVAWRSGVQAALRLAGFKTERVTEHDAGNAAALLNAQVLSDADFLARTCGLAGVGDIPPVILEALKTARRQEAQGQIPDHEHGPGFASMMEADLMENLAEIRKAQVAKVKPVPSSDPSKS